MDGLGKTSLTVQVTRAVADQFEVIILDLEPFAIYPIGNCGTPSIHLFSLWPELVITTDRVTQGLQI